MKNQAAPDISFVVGYEGSDSTISIGGKYSFKTYEEAATEVEKFKADPKSSNKHASEDDVKFWKTRTYVILKRTMTVEEVQLPTKSPEKIKDELRKMLSDYKAKESAWSGQKSEMDKELGKEFGIRAKEIERVLELFNTQQP